VIGSILLFALQASAAPAPAEPAPQTTVRAVRMGSINIPDEIAPAIVPYFDCQMASHGVRQGPPGSAQIIPPPEQFGASCSEARLHSARRAESMLRAQHRGSANQRRVFVERVLANVDTFVAAAGMPPPAPEVKTHAEN
jgi:hypothetical protein